MGEFKKTDLLKVPFTKMDIIPDLNKREDYGDIDELADSILEDHLNGGSGIKVPLEGYFKSGRFNVVVGHRRHQALRIIYEKRGIDLEVKVISEVRGTTDEQRLIDMVLTNMGKNLTPLEQFNIVDELESKYGYKASKIAKRLGKTDAYISRLKLLKQAPPEVITAIKDGKITGTSAIEAIRENLREKKADQIQVADLIEKQNDLSENEDLKYKQLSLIEEDNKEPEKPLVKVLEQDTDEEQNTNADGKKITYPEPPDQNEKSGIQKLNSWREFKKAAVFLDIKKVEPQKKDFLIFLFQLVNDELDQDQITRYFNYIKD